MNKQTPYETCNNEIGVKLSYLIAFNEKTNNKCMPNENSLQIWSYYAYKLKVHRKPTLRLRKGLGLGNEVLIRFSKLHYSEQEMLVHKFGNPETATNPMEAFYQYDDNARLWYDGFRFEDNTRLDAEQIAQYTINASVLNAFIALKESREALRKRLGNSKKNVFESVLKDFIAFKDRLKTITGGVTYNLPETELRLKQKISQYKGQNYHVLVDGRNRNKNPQVVTPEMIDLWMSIYAGQSNFKPTYLDVYNTYNAFLDGKKDIVNENTGEVYDKNKSCYKTASVSTIRRYQSSWELKAPAHAKRSGDRQVFKGLYEPYHKLAKPAFAGSIISIDDRQPPFECSETGERIWFYLGIDLGSEAITSWVYGTSKEGIILEFYRQMVRNYTMWGVNIPHELECEMSLNSSYTGTLLKEGEMFGKVRIEANNARGKRIERYFRELRYSEEYEKGKEGWIARPFAKTESNQKGKGKVPKLPTSTIIENSLRDIERWNNSKHASHDMSRWEYFEAKQHPNIRPTNYKGILPHIGYSTQTSMKAGRIKLQGKSRVVGYGKDVALGTDLIQIMKQIEGENVMVYWLDDNFGDVLKALVYDMNGEYVCDLLGDLEYQRASLERTPEDDLNRELTTAYAATVQNFIRESAKKINPVTIIKNDISETSGKFKIHDPMIRRYNVEEREPAKVLETQKEEVLPITTNFSTRTADRF